MPSALSLKVCDKTYTFISRLSQLLICTLLFFSQSLSYLINFNFLYTQNILSSSMPAQFTCKSVLLNFISGRHIPFYMRWFLTFSNLYINLFIHFICKLCLKPSLIVPSFMNSIPLYTPPFISPVRRGSPHLGTTPPCGILSE